MPTAYKIKTFPRPRARQRTELSGELYELVFTWRRRTQGWYVDVYRDDDGSPVVLGRRLRASADALSATLDIEGAMLGIGPDFPTVEQMGDEFSVYYLISDD